MTDQLRLGEVPPSAPPAVGGASPDAGRHDHATSVEAAEVNRRRRPLQRARVLVAFVRLGEATDDEVAVHTGIPANVVAKRRLELWRAELVTNTGRRRETRAGATAIVWAVTERGRGREDPLGDPRGGRDH